MFSLMDDRFTIAFIIVLVELNLFLCDPEVIDENLRCSGKFKIVTDLSQKDCGDNAFFVTSYNDTCFPGCLQKEEIPPEVSCASVDFPQCPPGFICEGKAIPKCVVDKTSCFKYYTDYGNNFYVDALLKPTCLDNGDWAPVQQKGGSGDGRLICYNARGVRIFGQANTDEKDTITCACSRKRDELERSGVTPFLSFHCDNMGNYERLQCEAGVCWCAEPKTGRVLASAVPEKAQNFLPCYEKKEVGSMYLRQCESELYAQAKITEKFTTHGFMYANFNPLLCSFDGTYGTYSISQGIVRCVWRDNSVIGSYQVEQGTVDLKDMDCNCARDWKMSELGGVSGFTLKCLVTGNYETKQRSQSGDYYCVDKDGFPISKPSAADVDCKDYTKYYDY